MYEREREREGASERERKKASENEIEIECERAEATSGNAWVPHARLKTQYRTHTQTPSELKG